MKGILLAGGHGSRLGPLTKTVSKQLMPIYSKPLIFYSLSTLLISGCKEILIITTCQDEVAYRTLLGDGEELGICIQYAQQTSPRGIAEALIIGEEFIANDNVCLCLGDNFLYGADLADILENTAKLVEVSGHAHIFCQEVSDPERYGIAEFDGKRVLAITEKPARPKSNHAVTGIYMYPPDVVDIAKQVRPSERGELEITSVNQSYLANGCLRATHFGRGVAWIDSGTPRALSDIGAFVRAIEEQQGLLICSPEEICWRRGYINDDEFLELVSQYSGSNYANSLLLSFKNKGF